MKNEHLSTYDQFMQDPERRKKFEESYGKFILVETLIPLLEKSKMPVRVLAKAAGVSPTIIQDIKSGKKEGISYPTFLCIIEALGFHATIQLRRKSVTRKRKVSSVQKSRPARRRKRVFRAV